ERLHAPALVPDEADGRHRVDALATLRVGRGDPVDVRPLGPRVVRGAPIRRPRQDLELVDFQGALTMRGAQAVGPGVAAPDDDHALALSADEDLVGHRVALAAPVLRGEG